MPIARYQEARQATIESYDAVGRRMGVEDDPPEGLLSHAVASMEGGGVRFWEVWESEDAMRRFEQERLVPAMREEFGGMPNERPHEEIAELHNFFAP